MRTNDPNEPRRQMHGGEAVPVMSVARSVTPTVIDGLEGKRPLRMLTRCLRVRYAMASTQDRAKWGLPDGYPMVAPNAR